MAVVCPHCGNGLFIETQSAPALPQDVAALTKKAAALRGALKARDYFIADDAIELLDGFETLILSQSSTIASAREVIEPFAAVAEFDIGDSESDTDIFKPVDGRHSVAGLLRVGHLRAAREWNGR